MDIKDENITKLMRYFDETLEAFYEAEEQYYDMFDRGIITKDTLDDAMRDMFRIPAEHDRIRNILFGTEAR